MTVLDELAPRIDTASAAELVEIFGELASATKYTEMKVLDRAIQQAANGSDPGPQADLSTADIARMYGNSQQAVRGWIGRGLLDAYKFQGREWRVTPASLEKFRREQREPLKLEVVKPPPDLRGWRKAAVGEAVPDIGSGKLPDPSPPL